MQKIQLSIPEPCHENWQNMTPTEQGRFCNACAKEVIDFSMMTDAEVLNYFNRLTHEKVCGRAMPSQLDRTMTMPAEPRKKLFWYWNYIVMFLLFFTKGNNAHAQTGNKPTTTISPVTDPGIRGQIMLAEPENKTMVVSGKVVSSNGAAIPFASLRLKGANTGVSADAHGNFSIKISRGSMLIITAVGHRSVEMIVSDPKPLVIVLERAMSGLIMVTNYSPDADHETQAMPVNKSVAVIRVKDDETGKSIPAARVLVNTQSSEKNYDADEQGTLKLRSIKPYEIYHVKVTAPGYQPNEFSIEPNDFKERKKEWMVQLKKQVPASGALGEQQLNDALAGRAAGVQVKSQGEPNLEKETAIRVGGVVAVDKDTNPVYVVDGIIEPPGYTVNTDDVEDVTVLQAPKAVALFGPAGANGAIVISTRKAKVKKLDTVTVSAIPFRKGMVCRSGSVQIVKQESYIADSIASVKNYFSGTIKIFPNPVQRNTSFSVALQPKQDGMYSLQVTDAAGSVFVQRKVNVTNKSNQIQLEADGRWAAGIYYVRIYDAKNKLISKSSFVVL